MSKNLTRKGLALGAVVALGTTLLAGAPAQAASVLFAPTTGTGNTLVAGETFSLTASLSADLPASNASQLKFKVVNTSGVNATVTLNGHAIVSSSTNATDNGPVLLDPSVGSTSTALSTDLVGTAAGASKTFGLGAASSWANGTAVAIAAAASTAVNPTTIAISSTAAATSSYAVTAFLDANNNGLLDSGELSAAQTVNFVKIADSGVSVNLSTPSQSTAGLKATIGFGADINVAQLTPGKYKIGFGKYTVNGVVDAIAGSGAVAVNTASNAVAYDSTNKVLKLNAANSVAVTSGTTYGAQAYYSNSSSSHVAVGSEVLAVAGTTQVNSVTTLGAAVTDNSTATTVRSGVTSAAFTQTIKANTSSTDSTQIAVGAGVPVAYTIASAPTLANDTAGVADTMSVNGVALTSSTTYPVTGTVLTDASGKITIPVVTRAGVATTAVTITTLPVNGASSLSQTATLTWTAATVNAPIDLSVGNAVHSVVKGGTMVASYALTDSYNALVTGSAYRLRFTENGTGTGATSNTVYVPFVSGIASVSLADTSTAAGTNVATYQVEKQTDGLWATFGSVVNAPFTVTAAAPVAAKVTVPAAATGATIDTAATYGSVDQRTARNTTAPSGFTPAKQTATGTTPAYAITADSRNVISGQVTDANGVGIAGASVTVAAPGVQFVSGSVTGGTWASGGSTSAVDTYTAFTLTAPSVYSVGSITVTADATGNYSVAAYSHVAGKIVYTVTSGAATASTSITYTGVSGYTTASKIAVAGPTTSQAARAATFTATVTDKLGNAVSGMALKATVSGVGSFAGSTSSDGSLALTTGTDGTVSIKVLFASNDLGDAVVTFADASGQTTPLASVSSTVAVGSTDANIDIVGNRVTAVTSFSKGKTVSFYVDGIKKWSKTSASDADVVLNYNLKKGTHTVAVKISGGFSTTEKFIVK